MAAIRIRGTQRRDILRLLALGWETEDIARKVGVTRRQVAAVKAHVTMRSYEQTHLVPHVVVETTNHGQFESLTPEGQNAAATSELLDKLQAELSSIAMPVGREVTTGKQVYWDPNPDYGSANPHLMIIGESGFGKTYTMQCVVAELALRGVPSVIIDYGRGFDLDVAPEEFINLTRPMEILAGVRGININPLQIHPSDINGPLNVAVRVSDSFSRVYRIGVQQHAVLRDAILEVFEDFGIRKADRASWGNSAPHLSDVHVKLDGIAADRLNQKAKTAMTLKSHLSTFFIFDTFRSSGEELSWDSTTLDGNSAYIIQLRGLEGRTQQIVTEFLLWDLYYYCVRNGPRSIHLYCVLDEAHNLSFGKDSPVDKLIREARKFGLGLIFASQQPQDFSDTAYANTASKLVFQTPDEKKRVAKQITNKCINVRDAAFLADTNAQLSRGQAFLITRNYGFKVAIKSLPARVAAARLVTSQIRKTT
jgi:DNA phosphorothioation-dependent restriction protein DptH